MVHFERVKLQHKAKRPTVLVLRARTAKLPPRLMGIRRVVIPSHIRMIAMVARGAIPPLMSQSHNARSFVTRATA
jgi:hypothetical protein